MHLPTERGLLSKLLIHALATGDELPECPLPEGDVTDDEDAQVALFVLYELGYRGFDEVPDGREWDPDVVRLRREVEDLWESQLRAATRETVASVDHDEEVGEALLELAGRPGPGPSPAAYLQREATREQVLWFLRQRSVHQLKESDPQSLVLPRIDGPAKVALAELQYDEYGGGRPERLHQQMFADALVGAGLDPTYGAYVDEATSRVLASGNVMSLLAGQRRLRGAACGHLAAFEATSPVPSRKIAAGIERVGLPPVVAAYFHEHVEADSVHEQVAARDICGSLVAQEPGLREDVLFGAATCLLVDELTGAEMVELWTRA